MAIFSNNDDSRRVCFSMQASAIRRTGRATSQSFSGCLLYCLFFALFLLDSRKACVQMIPSSCVSSALIFALQRLHSSCSCSSFSCPRFLMRLLIYRIALWAFALPLQTGTSNVRGWLFCVACVARCRPFLFATPRARTSAPSMLVGVEIHRQIC